MKLDDQIALLKKADKRRKQVIKMVNEGKSFAEIGQALDPKISRQAVQQIYKRATAQ